MPGDFIFFSLASAVLSPLLFLVVILVVVAAIGSTRNQPDPKGHRLTATYLCAIVFLSLFTALFAGTATLGSLMDITRDDGGGDGFSFDELEEGAHVEPFDGPGTDEDAAAGAVQALIIGGVAAGVLVYHRRKLIELVDDEGFRDGPGATVLSAYLYTSSLLGIIVFVVGASMALFGLAQVIAPGALSSNDADLAREDGARQLFTGAFLGLAALAVVLAHHRERSRLDEPSIGEEPIA